MSTPQQFLESFLHEKLAIYADANVRLAPMFARYFGEPLLDRAGDFLLLARMREVIDDVAESAGSALVVTSIQSERFAGASIRARYHLAATGETWKITRIDRQCVYCRGTGQSGQAPCQQCGGEGWNDRGEKAA